MRKPGGAWIKVVTESDATGETKAAYERMREVNQSYGAMAPGAQPFDVNTIGQVIGPPHLSSLSPKAMVHGRELMMEIMRGPSRLSPAQREMIATVTSITMDCRY